MRHVCVDAGFLIGLYDDRDQHHEIAKGHFSRLFGGGGNRMVLPWPILYEAVSTRMVGNRNGMNRLENDWKKRMSGIVFSYCQTSRIVKM